MIRGYGIIPHALILDTNVLLDFLAPDKYTEKEFATLMFDSWLFAEVLIPQQVLDEWNYLKDNTVSIHHTNIQKNAKDITNLIKKLPNQTGHKHEVFEELYKLARRSYEYSYAIRKDRIDNFISTYATIIETRNIILDSLVIDLAIQNFVPFFSNEEGHSKNESTDALIFFGIVEFMKLQRKDYDKVIFISFNKHEFAQKRNPTKLHENLAGHFENLDIGFTNHLNSAFNYLGEPKEKEYMIGPKFAHDLAEKEKYLSDEFFITCKNSACDNEVHINIDTILINQYYYYQCRKCKHKWNSGESLHDKYN